MSIPVTTSSRGRESGTESGHREEYGGYGGGREQQQQEYGRSGVRGRQHEQEEWGSGRGTSHRDEEYVPIWSRDIESKLNEAAAFELKAHNCYLNFAHWAAKNSFHGIKKYFQVCAQEEMCDAQCVYEYIYKRNGLARTPTIEQTTQPDRINSVSEMFEKTLQCELKVMRFYNDLLLHATEQKDVVTATFLKDMLKKQTCAVEEAQVLRDKFYHFDKMSPGLVHLFDFIVQKIAAKKCALLLKKGIGKQKEDVLSIVKPTDLLSTVLSDVSI